MGRHILGRGDSGEITVRQVGEEEAMAMDGVQAPPMRAAGLLPDQAGDVNPQLADLLTSLYERNGAWARVRIMAIASERELARVQEAELAHPRTKGGRNAVLEAITERSLELQAKRSPELAGAGA